MNQKVKDVIKMFVDKKLFLSNSVTGRILEAITSFSLVVVYLPLALVYVIGLFAFKLGTVLASFDDKAAAFYAKLDKKSTDEKKAVEEENERKDSSEASE